MADKDSKNLKPMIALIEDNAKITELPEYSADRWDVDLIAVIGYRRQSQKPKREDAIKDVAAYLAAELDEGRLELHESWFADV